MKVTAPVVSAKTSAPVLAESSSAPRQDESAVIVPRSDVDAAEPSRGVEKNALLASSTAKSSHPGKLHNALGARMAAITGAALDASHSHGLRALEKRMNEIEKMAKAGVKVRCVFDLDNTLFDTRARTLAAAKMFDEQNGTSYFKDATLDAMKLDGRETAIALGLPDAVIEAFGALWDKEFWNPDNLVHDEVMSSVVEIALEAKRRGAELVFLTGRTERFIDKDGVERGFREATRAQLLRAGLPTNDEAIVLKPGLGVRTAEFKEQQLRAYEAEGAVGFFITEGRRDIQHVSTTMTELACFLLDSRLEDGGPPCHGVPVLPGVM